MAKNETAQETGVVTKSPQGFAIEAGVEWRQLRAGLWVVRANGRPLGIIERGRRYTITDANENVTKGFPSFTLALQGLVAPGPSDAPSVAQAKRRIGLAVPTFSSLVGVVLGSIGLHAQH